MPHPIWKRIGSVKTHLVWKRTSSMKTHLVWKRTGSVWMPHLVWKRNSSVMIHPVWKRTGFVDVHPAWKRASYDEKNHEIAPVMIQWWWSRIDDPNQVMIQIQWWCLVMIQIQWWWPVMIQIEWWSRSSDDPDLNMKMTWIWRWLEDEDDLKMQMTRWSMEEDQWWKLCQENTFLVKRECWCICNFGMCSSMYLMYCNPMFILRCIYNVIESCFHAPMFRSGGSIM